MITDNKEELPSTITYDDFFKVDIRVGTVTAIEVVPKSKKLLKLQVDFGNEIGTRTILAGIAKDYSFVIDNMKEAEYNKQMQVVAVVNLAPREMMGIMSHGMLLAVHTRDDKVSLLQAGNMVDVVNGTKVG